MINSKKENHTPCCYPLEKNTSEAVSMLKKENCRLEYKLLSELKFRCASLLTIRTVIQKEISIKIYIGSV